MGAPSSGIIAEIFFATCWKFTSCTPSPKNTINYFRYVDNILLIFGPNHTDIQEILTDFNAIRPKLHFTAETEDSSHNYLDISIRRTPTGLRTSIYRNPTFTDTIIPYTYNTPHNTKTQQ
jgi:hypothetical protein